MNKSMSLDSKETNTKIRYIIVGKLSKKIGLSESNLLSACLQ